MSEGLGLAPERAEWVRAWFAGRYEDLGVFDDGAEALTLEAACQLVSDARAAERERLCAAIKAEDDHCCDQGDYMLDSDDCISVIRGTWTRPEYNPKA